MIFRNVQKYITDDYPTAGRSEPWRAGYDLRKFVRNVRLAAESQVFVDDLKPPVQELDLESVSVVTGEDAVCDVHPPQQAFHVHAVT